MLKIYILPSFPNQDRGEGGIRRVVEAQKKWLPKFGFEPVDDIKLADIVALHAGEWETPPDVGVPVVSHCHGLYWDDYVWPSYAAQINRIVLKNLKLADAITAPSEWVRNAIARNTWLNPDVLYHGIEPDEWPEPVAGNNANYVLWNKTRPDAICDPTPVTELADRVPNQRFVTTFINPGKERANILVTGTEPYGRAKERVMGACVYLATTRETFGIGTLEAMAAGVPILAYDWGGQPEIIVHKEHGYLVEPGDFDDLAVGLTYINDHRDYLSHNARQRVFEQFTWEYWIEQYAKLYNRVINEHRAPKVSVVITNYNLNAYLPEALASAKAECAKIDGTYEIILVDDASTIPLSAEIEHDKVCHVIKNPTNLHLAGSLNVGVGAATGRYVLCLDADNRIKNLPSLVRALDANRGLDIAYGKMEVFGDNYDKPWVSEWPPKEARLEEQLTHHNQVTSTALYRRKLFDWIGGYRTRCSMAEDADFWCRALAVGATARRVTDQVTLEYRDRPDSMSHVNPDWLWNRWYDWASSKNRLSLVGGPIYTYEKPIISVVIPVGPGHEKLVADAVDSVQAQSVGFKEWECIVINDTPHKLKGLPAWARVIPGGGLGVSHARNRGMLLSKGEYILFLDADDYLHPEALYHLYQTAITSNCQNVFVYSDWFEGESGQRHESLDFNPKTVFDKLAHPVTALYRKWDLTKSNVLWDESFKDGWEDWDFGIQVAAKAGLCGIRVRAPLLHYRLKSGKLRSLALSKSEEIKLKINHKWADYISGSQGGRMPGCGGCGGGRYPSLMSNIPRSNGMFDSIDIDKETTLIEYTPPPDWTGTRSFLGRVTGNRYRFSPDASGRVRRVYNVDVPGLENIGFFRKVAASGADPENITPLAAPGPPVGADA